MDKKFLKDAGFTLIELMLYVVIAAAMLGSIAFFLALDLQSQIKYQVISEVEQQAAIVLNLMTQAIRNAESINLPVQGSNDSSLSLDVVDVLDDPTVFSLSNNIIYISEGAQSSLALTSDQVQITNLAFYNLSKTGTPGNIRIVMAVSYHNPQNRQEFDYSKTFYATASLRQ